MTIEQAASAAQLLGRRGWRWDLQSWAKAEAELSLDLKEESGQRFTYELPTGLFLDVFRSGGQIELLEVTLDEFSELESLDELSYEDKVDEYYDKFRAAVRNVSSEFGAPEFCNGSAANGFPQDQDAVWLALWRIPNGRMMVQQKHEDRELPFRICLVVAPDEER